jgi:filamentous hemagglutinin family protein
MKIKYLLLSIFNTCFLLLCADTAGAQISPSQGDRVPVSDNTLNTQVDRFGNNYNITGGLQRGQNVFHSFSDFSVPTNGAANFFNPAGNQSIITRVTGNIFSDINGRVNTNGANFFLINPSGIIFGPNASFNVGKSFVATTANSIDLVDGSGGRYNFGARNGNDAPLISVNANVLFNVDRLNIVNGSNSGIINYGNINPNNPGQYIGLIGGNINLLGGSITAPGGRVDLGGINTSGAVSIGSTGLLFSGENIGRSDIFMRNGASVSVRARETLTSVEPVFFTNAVSNGSSINIGANNVELVNAGSTADIGIRALDAGLEVNSGVKTNSGGDISISATGLISLDNSIVGNTLRAGAEGRIGGVKIDGNRLTLTNNSSISTLLSGTGSAGDIDIRTTGDISISGSTPSSTAPITDNSPISGITSQTVGKGNAGRVTMKTDGKLLLSNRAVISSSVDESADGNGQDVSITAREIELSNSGTILTDNFDGTGNAGNIGIKTTGDIRLDGGSRKLAIISSTTGGRGNSGAISIETQGKLQLSNGGAISSAIGETAIGKGLDITISAREIDLSNSSFISSDNLGGTGNAGNININTTGDVSVSGSIPSSTAPITDDSPLSFISAQTRGKGDGGKITIATQGKLSLSNRATISNSIGTKATGNSQGISIFAREIDIKSSSDISSLNLGGTGNAGNINVNTTGDISISGSTPSSTAPITDDSPLSFISAITAGKGDSGKITIVTQGKLSLSNRGAISSSIFGKDTEGNSQGISISARELDLRNDGSISSNNGAQGGDSGAISIDTQGKLILANRSSINNSVTGTGIGNARDIKINARELDLSNGSFISSATLGRGNAGNISIKTTGDVSISGSTPSTNVPITESSPTSFITTLSTSQAGIAGSVRIDAGGKVVLSNKTNILTVSSNSTGGDIFIKAGEYLLLNKSSLIGTDSFSRVAGNGGNISIDSPLIIATPSGDNDISANANGGNGGRIDIISQGLFGIGYRPNGVNSPLTNDITASSTFGQSGTVNVNTPDIDPGKDTAELPEAPQDKSDRIDRACSPTQAQNKFYVTGRGGKAPTGDETLNNDEVWLDDRNSSPTAAAPVQPVAKQYQPAHGWVFGADGKVSLIAADVPPVNPLPACPPPSSSSNSQIESKL